VAGQTNKLSPEAAGAGLDDRLARGGPVIVASQLAKGVIRLGATVAMARLLTPEAYGVFGMAAIAYGFFQVGGDAGLTAAGVQRRDLTAATASALFWLQLAVGAIQAALMALSGPLLAGFYHEPQLARLVLPLAAALLLTNLGAQFRVHLLRNLRYPTVAVIEVAGQLGGAAAGLAAAATGAGFWALAAMVAAQELFIASGLVLACGWRPGRWPGPGHAHGLFAFAAGATTSGYANYGVIFCDQFLVGRWFGPLTLGLYGRAGQLSGLPGSVFFGPLTGWMIHALSRLQGNPDEFRAFFRRVVGGLMHACCPLAALLMAAPETCLGLLLGPQWLPAAPLLRALAPGLFLLPFSFADIWVLLGVGAGRRLAAWSAARLLVLVAALVAARPAGIETVAWTMGAVALLTNLAGWFIVARVSPLRISDFIETTWRPVFLAALWGCALAAGMGRFSSPAATVAAALPIYVLALVVWPSARRGVTSLLALTRPARR
jgi:O-antigen/teichoic acid export membrane protein